jgi:hypothetical protein
MNLCQGSWWTEASCCSFRSTRSAKAPVKASRSRSSWVVLALMRWLPMVGPRATRCLATGWCGAGLAALQSSDLRASLPPQMRTGAGAIPEPNGEAAEDSLSYGPGAAAVAGGRQHGGGSQSQPLKLAGAEEAGTHWVGSGTTDARGTGTTGEAEGSMNTAQDHRRDCVTTEAAHIHGAQGNEGKGLADMGTAELWAERSATGPGFRQGDRE